MSDALFYGCMGLLVGSVIGFAVTCRLFAAMQADLLAIFSKSHKG